MGKESVFLWNAREVVDSALAAKPSLSRWRDWMYKWYFDGNTNLRELAT